MTKLRIPVGKTNYNAIRRGNYAYADKTHWLPIFENLYCLTLSSFAPDASASPFSCR